MSQPFGLPEVAVYKHALGNIDAFSTRIALATITEDHEPSLDDEIIHWCGLNELLFAVEMDGIMELSAEPFL